MSRRRVILRVWVTGKSGDGPAVSLAANNWTESGITWQNRPALTSGTLADLGSTPSGRWAEWNVTAAIAGDGTYTFAVIATSSDGTDFTSKEGSTANAPQLVITP